MGLVYQLGRLVQATQDPATLIYVSTFLSWGDPTMSFCFLRALGYVRFLAFQGLLFASLVPHHGMPQPPGHGGVPMIVRQGVPPGLPLAVAPGPNPQFERMRLVQQQIRREVDIRQEAQRLLILTQLRETVEKMIKDKPDLLCKKIRDGSPLERLIAIQVIGRRRLPLEKDLIPVLRDPDKMIRQTAHEALVRISRGTDFGPSPGVSKRGLGRAVEKWQKWLDLQERSKPLRSDPTLALAAGAPLKKIPFGADKFVGLESRSLSRQTSHMSDELVKAAGDEQKAVLKRLRDAEGESSLEALAVAIPQLNEDRQIEVREALTDRLTRLGADALRDRLQDDNLEIRCAAALACGRKIAKEHIPDLLLLLDDPEMDVVLSARVALNELTGEDFGPTRDGDQQGRTEAAEAWRKWWKEHQTKR